MHNQLVAGTVMLNDAKGEKKFLVKVNEDDFDFVMTPMNEELTNLACFLEELKTEVLMDVSSIDLVELTSIKVDDKKMPFFLFELEETTNTNKLANNYKWETAKTLTNVLSQWQFAGVPIF